MELLAEQEPVADPGCPAVAVGVRKPDALWHLNHLYAPASMVAGSTMPGEEEQVLDAFSRLGGGERALLILAPRHPERFLQAAELVRQAGHAVARRSALEEAVPGCAVLLLDSLGELAGLYALADVAFIGGTLVPAGCETGRPPPKRPPRKLPEPAVRP